MGPNIVFMFIIALKCRATTFLENHLEATSVPVVCTGHPTPLLLGVQQALRPILVRAATPCSNSSVQ